MGPLPREMVTISHADDGGGLILGGETASLLDAARTAPPSGEDPFSRAFETGGGVGGGGGGGYTAVIEERMSGGPEGEHIGTPYSYHSSTAVVQNNTEEVVYLRTDMKI